MPTLLSPVAIQQFKDNNGNPLAGGQLYTYAAGTSTFQASYTDATGTSANSNPVILNSRGEAPLWLTPGQFYKLVLQDASSVLIWSADQVPGGLIDAAVLPDIASSNKVRADLIAASGSSLVSFIQAGTGSIARTVQSKSRDILSVLDYFFASDATADPMFARAIAAASAIAGGGVFVPIGVYIFAAEVAVPSNVEIVGAGFGSIIKPNTAMRSLFNVTGGLCAIRHLSIQNVSSFAANGIFCNKPANNLSIEIEYNYFSSFSNAIRWTSGDRAGIRTNSFVANAIAINFVEDGRNSSISQNYILGGSGLSFDKTTQGAEGVTIDSNIILPGNTGAVTYCMNINAGLEFYIDNNIFDQVYSGVAIQMDGSSKSVDFMKFSDNWFGTQVGATGASYGIYSFGAVRGTKIKGGTFIGFKNAAIYLNGSGSSVGARALIDGVEFYSANVNMRDIQLDYHANVNIKNCNFSGTSSIVEGVSVTGRVDACGFNILPAITALKYGQQLYGKITYNSGSANLPATLKQVTITHSLDSTPLASDILITPTSFGVNFAGEVVIDNITTTTFHVTCRNDPGTGGLTFSWTANVAR